MSKKRIEILEKEIEELRQKLNYIVSLQNEDWLDSAEMKMQFHFSESKLYRLRKEKKIPYLKIGGRYHYPKSVLNEFLFSRIET